LRNFAACADSQRAWLCWRITSKIVPLRRDFRRDWWPRLLAVPGQSAAGGGRVPVPACKTLLPTELAPCANLDRFAAVEEAEQEQQL